MLRTEIQPASGTYLDFRDVYGRQFWVDMLTDHVAMDFYLIRQGAAALKVQAIWKGRQVRRQIWEMHVACATIARAWNKYQFDRILKQINKQRLKSTIKIQEAWRLCRLRWACSRQMYKLLGAIGGRPGRAANKRVDGLLHSNYSFVSVYRAVVHLQRSCGRPSSATPGRTSSTTSPTSRARGSGGVGCRAAREFTGPLPAHHNHQAFTRHSASSPLRALPRVRRPRGSAARRSGACPGPGCRRCSPSPRRGASGPS